MYLFNVERKETKIVLYSPPLRNSVCIHSISLKG